LSRFDEEKTMRGVISKVQRFVVSEDGPTAVEYAVMLALIVVACVSIVGALGKSISGTFSSVSSTLGSS
jgi:pilus assembly protein Flp/PilA